MAKQLNEETSFNISIKTLAGIQEAKELPVPPPAEITRMEFDMKDQLVRQTIMTTQEDVKELKESIKRLEEKIDKLR